jgi:predicted phosphoribosyltransferase
MQRRMERYREGQPMQEVRGKTVLLVDDGLATGGTARAAIAALRRMEPRRIVLAVPVCAPEAASALRGEADEVVCLAAPEDFHAVGYWYQDFDQTTDDEVLRLLNDGRAALNVERPAQ